VAGRGGGAVPQVDQAGPDTGGGDRRSRLLSGTKGGSRSVAIAVVSTVVFVGVVTALILTSPGWDEVKQTFFDGDVFTNTFGDIASAFVENVKIFLIAEAIVLPAALILAILRSLPGPVFFPVRLFAAAYADVFRGIPAILLILMLGFGVPALQIEGVPKSPFFWGIFSLVLLYTAYVSEVYRAGIESIHPSQDAAARSLGLSRVQSLAHVILPQAIRRVVPPLLNDFIALQKDSALVYTVGVVEGLRQAQIETSAAFNYTPFVGVALMFLVITIPLTRFTDWLIARDRRKRQASGALA
jgi:polar amino acid transport system permease protein